MKISEQLKDSKINVSCEISPPKKSDDLKGAYGIVEKIAQLNPDFISVTYGAGGSTAKTTVPIASYVQKCGVTALAHLTCVSSTRSETENTLSKLKENGIENILALRGDIPQGSDFPTPKQYHYAYELISEIKSRGDFCIGGACYPEGHVECEHKENDINYLKQKVDCGCDFLITQMFFDNDVFYNFLYRILAKRIDVPVIAGIMPVTNVKQIKRITAICGTSLTPRLKAIIDRFADDPPAMKQAGIAYATDQIIGLIANGVRSIHIYTMNKPDVAAKIFENISSIIV